jgi:hypothetical protein
MGPSDDRKKSERLVLPSPDGSLLGPGRKLPTLEALPRASYETRRVFDSWRAIKIGDRLPRLADWKPIGLADLLPAILIADVLENGENILYRQVGAQEIEARGYDPTGKTLRDIYEGEVLDFALENYQLACRSPWGIVDQSIDISPNPRFIELETLFLPFAEDGVTATQILVYSHYRVS